MNKWLSNPNVVKIIALILGILLWVVVSTDQRGATGTTFVTDKENTITNVKITPIYDSEMYHIQTMDPSEVMIKVIGKDSALKKVNVATYRIVLDLTNAKVGENTIPLKPEKFPSGVEVSIYPPYVRVVLEEKKQKEMPVQVDVVGTPAVGFKAGQPVVNPTRVVVTAASSMIDNVAIVRAEVNVDQASTAVSKQVKLVALDASGKQLQVALNPQVVDIEVPVTQPFKMMPLQIKPTGLPAVGYSVASFVPNVNQITVYGPQELLNAMEFYEGPPIDLTGLKENKTFTLDIPLRQKVTSLDPGKIEVKVEIVPSSTRVFDQVPITIVGQNDVFDTKVTTPTTGGISLMLEGAPGVLDKLKLQDVQAIVDVSNFPPGKHEVSVNVNVSPFVRRAGPEVKATVEISAKTTPIPTPVATPGGVTGEGSGANGAGGGNGSNSVPTTGTGTVTPTPAPTPTPTPSPTQPAASPSPTGTPVPITTSPSPSGTASSNSGGPGTGTVAGVGASGAGGKGPNDGAKSST